MSILQQWPFKLTYIRFKDLADSAAAAAAAGTYTLDDEEYVQLKARAIIDCYIDSQVPPKLQVSIGWCNILAINGMSREF